MTVQRRQSVGDRLRGGRAPVTAVAVLLGEQRFLLQRRQVGGSAVASVAHEVGGIVLSTRRLPLAEWSHS